MLQPIFCNVIFDRWYSTYSVVGSYLANSIVVFLLGLVKPHHVESAEREVSDAAGSSKDTEMLLNY